MIAFVRKNVAFILVYIAMMLAAFLPIRDMLDKTDQKVAKVPTFKLPAEMNRDWQTVTKNFPEIKKEVLLGQEHEVIEKPIQVSAKKKPGLRPLRLRAIMIDGKTRIANINGSLLKEGSYINGRTVLKINESNVLVKGPDGKRNLTIR